MYTGICLVDIPSMQGINTVRTALKTSCCLWPVITCRLSGRSQFEDKKKESRGELWYFLLLLLVLLLVLLVLLLV